MTQKARLKNTIVRLKHQIAAGQSRYVQEFERAQRLVRENEERAAAIRDKNAAIVARTEMIERLQSHANSLIAERDRLERVVNQFTLFLNGLTSLQRR